MRIHARAQGNAETAHYSLSPLGWEEWSNLDEADHADPRPVFFAALIDKWYGSTDHEMQRIQLGLMASLGLHKPAVADGDSRPMSAFVDGVAESRKETAISEAQTSLFCNSLATDLISLEVMELDRDGSLRFRKSRDWEKVPVQLRDEPRLTKRKPATKLGERPQTPASTAPVVSKEIRERVLAHA